MSLTDDAMCVVDAGLISGNWCDFDKIDANRTDAWPKDELISAAVRLAIAYIEAGKVDGGGCPRCGSEVHVESNSGKFYRCGSSDAPYWGQSNECRNLQIARLTARLATVSAERDEHKRRLMEQSAVLNAVRQERDELKRKAGGE